MRDCIEWKGARNRKGYGQVRILGKQLIVHRVAYRLFKGTVGRFHVLHKCDNPPCYNPKHLFLGTNFDNQRDAVKKGRQAQAKKTQCPRGHALKIHGYARPGTKWRECKLCQRKNVERWRARGISR